MIVTIDGPAGAGKSTAARALAQRLGFEFLDTGAMYRAVTWAAIHQGVNLEDTVAIALLARSLEIRFDGSRVFVDGVDVAGDLRSPHVTGESRHVAGNLDVRRHLVTLQQQFAENRNIVTEGRDQGTVVFPHAQCKFYVTADPRERAARRQREFAERGQAISLDDLLSQQRDRDERDATRDFGGMKPASDAVTVDTTGLSHDQVLELLEQQVRSKMN